MEEGRIGTLKELYLVRDALSRKIEDKGYFLSRAIIPPQTIMASSQGEEAMPPAAACLFLVKGSIAALREVQASSQDEKDSFKPLVDEWLKPALGVSSASTSGPASITKTQFEDAVLRLNDLPGVSVETVLTTSKGAWQRPLSGEQYGRICAKMAQKTTSCEAAPKRFVIATHMRRPGAEACTSSAGDEGSPDGNDGGASGQTDPFLSSQDLIPLVNRHNGQVFFGLDNRNNHYVGHVAAEGGGEIYLPPFSPDGWVRGERLGGRYKRMVGEDRLASWDVGGDVWVEDVKVALSYGHSRSLPGGVLLPLELDSVSDTWAFYVSRALLRTRETNITVRGGVEHINTTTTVVDNKLVEDRLRVVRLGATFDGVHLLKDVARLSRWEDLEAFFNLSPAETATLLDVELSQGLRVLGATPDGYLYASREMGQSDFTKLKATLASVWQILPDRLSGVSIYAAASGQWARTPLLVAEQFGLGGKDFGRAFEPAEYTGDHGLAGIAELRWSVDPALDFAPFLHDLQPYLFVDGGRVWQRASDTGIANATVASAGLGMRGNLVFFRAPGFERVGATFDLQGAMPVYRTTAIEHGTDEGMNFFFLLGLRGEF